MAVVSTGARVSARPGTQNRNYTGPLAVLTSLFFIWAFVTNLNDILIPQLQKACNLSDFESSLVQFAFFGAYFIMSLPSGWVIKKVGYKNGIIVGLITMFIGALLFVPAAASRTYLLFLTALFILASGVTLLQVAANAYVSILGKPETASARLNLTQAFNSLGATLGPIVGAALIFTGVNHSTEELLAMPADQVEAWRAMKASSVVMPYLAIAGILVLISLLIFFSKLPQIDGELEHEAETDHSQAAAKGSALQYSHLFWGVVAIFFYVGAEVAIASFMIKFAGQPHIGGLEEKEASFFPATYMFLAMCGRFLGAAILGRLSPAKVLGFNALAAMGLLAFAVTGTGMPALYAAVAVGFFNSIMFPTIFTLGVRDLGIYTKQGSSLLIMAIVGGALIPPLMGYVSDVTNSIQTAYIVPALCYIFVAFFGFVGSKVKNPLPVESEA